MKFRKLSNRFQAGSGCYNCSCCGRKTRSTGDEGDLSLCFECYEMSGIENLMNDQGETPELRADYERLKQACIEKGGRL